MGYLTKRVARGLLTILVVSTLVFLVLRLKGDPAAAMLPPEATKEDIVRLRQKLGLDQPIAIQYSRFIVGIATGKSGNSFRYDEPVSALIAERLPITILLAVSATAVALVVGASLGILAAVRRNTILDYLISSLSFVATALPAFWLGVMLIIMFSLKLAWFPTSGSGTPRHLVLPVLTLMTWPVGQIARLTRSEMISVLNQDFIRTARAKGLREVSVIFGHCVKNVAIPVVTLVGLMFGALLGGAIVTETIFGLPGLGRLIIQSVFSRDYPLVQAGVVYMGVVFVVSNLLIDIVYTMLDPRVRI